MPESRALSKFSDHFSRYIPLSGGEAGIAGHLQDPRQGPETGQTPDRGGPGWRRRPPGVGRAVLLAGTAGRRSSINTKGLTDAVLRGCGSDLGRRGAERQRTGAPGKSAGPTTLKARAWSSTSAGKPVRPCGQSDPRTSCSTRKHRCSGSPPGRSAGRVQAAGLGDGYTGHSGRVGMAQDLVKSGVELPALMTAGRWKSSKMPARYTERKAADRGRGPGITRTTEGVNDSQ